MIIIMSLITEMVLLCLSCLNFKEALTYINQNIASEMLSITVIFYCITFKYLYHQVTKVNRYLQYSMSYKLFVIV